MSNNRSKISKKSILITIIICILCIGIILFRGHINDTDNIYAIISLDGEVISSIDLSHAKDETFTINNLNNITFQIKDNKIRFLQNDCKNQVCINTGYISNIGDMAVCLPKKVSIEIKDHGVK